LLYKRQKTRLTANSGTRYFDVTLGVYEDQLLKVYATDVTIIIYNPVGISQNFIANFSLKLMFPYRLKQTTSVRNRFKMLLWGIAPKTNLKSQFSGTDENESILSSIEHDKYPCLHFSIIFYLRHIF